MKRNKHAKSIRCRIGRHHTYPFKTARDSTTWWLRCFRCNRTERADYCLNYALEQHAQDRRNMR